MARSRLRAAALAGVTALTLLTSAAPALARPPARPRPRRADHLPGLVRAPPTGAGGSPAGTRVVPGARAGVTLARPAGTTEYADPHTGATRTWEYATWTSPVTRIGFDATELVASWNAETPAGTWIQVEMQGTYTTGDQTPWYVMGRWASGDTGHQADHASTGRATPGRRSGPTPSASTTPPPGCCCGRTSCKLTLYRAPGQSRRPGGPDARRDELERAGPVHRPAERRATSPGAASCRCRATRRTCTPGTTPSTTAAARPGARPPPPRWWSSTGVASRRRPTPPGWTRPTPTRRSTTPPG